MYAIDASKLDARPEMRVGDNIFRIDNRLSTFVKINQRIKERDGGSDFEIIISEALGSAVYQQIVDMDLAYGVMNDIVIIILAAIQDITTEEARSRFRQGG